MSDSVQHEIWQVEVAGQVYEADFAELASWVAEGALQPDDRVRRGNLRWIEAKRVPTLVPHFNAKRDGTAPPPVVVTVTSGTEPSEKVVAPAPPAAIGPPTPENQPPTPTVVLKTIAANPDFCAKHQSTPSVFLCDSCGRFYCKECPNSYG